MIPQNHGKVFRNIVTKQDNGIIDSRQICLSDATARKLQKYFVKVSLIKLSISTS